MKNSASNRSASGPPRRRKYDSRFVPALYGPWGPRLVADARLAPGHRAVDIGCGTGALALAAASTVGPDGKVWGVDPSPEMLAVARLNPSAVEWLEGRAEALPLPDDAVDAALCQFAMMFVEDRPAAFREMARVTRPGGEIRVAVPATLEEAPGYMAFADLLGSLFGDEMRDGFARPFALLRPEALMEDAEAGGLAGETRLWPGEVQFATTGDLVSAEPAFAWLLGGLLDRDQFARLSAESEAILTPFRRDDGTCVFDLPARVFSARAPGAGATA
ncbi:MAG: methyltransferase domain-containing protein [Paracoccaceae bacterium]